MAMRKLDTSGWHEFRVGDLFDIHPTKHYNDSDGKALSNAKLMEPDGVNPIVVNSSYNNGIGGYTNKPCNEKGGIITFSDTTTADAIFYQPNDFVGYSHVQGMYPTGKYVDKWSMYSMKFFESVFHSRANALGYNYVNKFTRELASNIIVLLPIDKDSNPDWTYMETYMADIEIKVRGRISKLESVKKLQNTAIDIHEWGVFHIYDIFDIDAGSKLDKVKMDTAEPEINFVGRSNFNNGITDKVKEIKGLEPYAAGNLTLALGGAYLGSCFLQEERFYTSQNVAVLKPKSNLSNYTKQFIATAIFKESQNNYKAFENELNAHIKTDFQFKLPITLDGTPDFEYMDKYMQKVHGGGDTSIASVDKRGDVIPWGKFAVGDLFEISLSKDDIQPKNTMDGNIPLVSSGKENNGIVSMIAKTNATLQSAGTITVDMFGKAFYQENEYYCVSHGRVNILTPKIPLNLYSGLFIANIIESVSLYKYSFEEMCTGTKLSKDIIYLPICLDGTPNISYMERYMKNLERLVQTKMQLLTTYL